jgi:hypothetical protein
MRRWPASPRVLKRLFAVAAISSVLLAPGNATAAQDIPDVIVKGLADYQSTGPDAAVKTWLKGSAVESSPEAQSQGNVFRQIEAMYGKYLGYHVIKIKELTPTCTLAFLTLDYEKGPLFAYFTAYKVAEKWIIANMNYNTKAEAVLPESVID